jgi:hypothetical protein
VVAARYGCAVTSRGPYDDYVSVATQLTRGQLLDILLDVEDRLRKLIRVVFAQKRPDWEKLVPEAIRQELHSATSGPPDGWPSAGPRDLLSNATLKQLIDTLLARWGLFEPLLHDKALLSAHLEEFRIWRNQLAHGAQPTKDQRVKIAFVAWEVAHQIPIPSPPEIASSPAPAARGFALFGRRILWADDLPENNRLERRWLQDLGADVVPVLSNEEAVMEATSSRFDVAVSDIDRGGEEPGSQLGVRLNGVGVQMPIVFFVANVDSKTPPFGGVGITNDPADLLRMVIDVLRPPA